MAGKKVRPVRDHVVRQLVDIDTIAEQVALLASEAKAYERLGKADDAAALKGSIAHAFAAMPPAMARMVGDKVAETCDAWSLDLTTSRAETVARLAPLNATVTQAADAWHALKNGGGDPLSVAMAELRVIDAQQAVFVEERRIGALHGTEHLIEARREAAVAAQEAVSP